MGIKKAVKSAVKAVLRPSREYSAMQEERINKTPEGAASLAKTKASIAKSKATIKDVASGAMAVRGLKRMASSTGSMVKRGVDMMMDKLPKREKH